MKLTGVVLSDGIISGDAGLLQDAQRRVIRTMTPAATARTASMTPLPVKRTWKCDMRPPAASQTPRKMLPLCIPVFSLLSAMINRMPVTMPSTARIILLFENEMPPRGTRFVRTSQGPEGYPTRSS